MPVVIVIRHIHEHVILADDRPGHPWVMENHVGANHRTAQAAQVWLRSHGLFPG